MKYLLAGIIGACLYYLIEHDLLAAHMVEPVHQAKVLPFRPHTQMITSNGYQDDPFRW